MNEVEIPFGNRTERRVALAVQLGLAAFGGLVMILAWSDGHVAALVIGALVGVGGLVGGGIWRRRARLRRLVVEAHGLRWEEKNGSWAVPWYELRGVGLSRTGGTKPSLWLHLVPREENGFAATYRSIPKNTYGYWIPLADETGGPMLDLALQRFAPQLYRGFVRHFTEF
ncbi:hypothetical protein [Saccharothrix sp. NRRL B-16314]|uniref:hypothetical protein n=1 Tax=Saccharothrix sp. NRRL B-16314 TaxID=1463825 RepID=UPI000526AAA8|nr:hypothetical protein [Saccharothrix sp. NRRL B-16314]